MIFRIMSEREIGTYEEKFPHIIISIRSPKTNKAKISYNSMCLNGLFLEFHDLNDAEDVPNAKLFSVEDAEKIKEFVKEYSPYINTIICQCEAGISRSAGVAGALSKVLNGDDTDIFKRYSPNTYVYNKLLKIFQ